MRVLFAGTPAVAVPSLRLLLDRGFDVVAVLTQPARPKGRSGQPVPSAVAVFAHEHSIPVLSPAKVSDCLAELTDLQIDVAAVVAYGQLLPKSVLAASKSGWVNLHFSLLPHLRGAAPAQWSIISGDDVTGASTFLLDEGMDTGPVLGTFTTQVPPAQTASGLLADLAESGAELLAQTLSGIESGQLQAVPQDHSLATYAPKLTASDALVRWQDPAIAVDRRIRGCTDQPGAWTLAAGEKLLISPVEITDEVLPPGLVRASKQEVLVGTGSSAVRLGQVKPAGKRWMSAGDWVRGLREPVERLGE